MESSEIVPPNGNNFSMTCRKCALSIDDPYFVKAVDSFWHERCLCCSACERNLPQLGSSLYIKHGRVLCKNDYLRLFGPTATCTGCGKQIFGNDMVMKKDADTVYHFACFTCTNCKREFCAGDKCVSDKSTGKIYCLENECRASTTKEKKPRKSRKKESTSNTWKRGGRRGLVSSIAWQVRLFFCWLLI